MNKFFLFLALNFSIPIFSQSPEFNLQKYWFYRERFKNFFVSIGTQPGQSLAVAMIAEGENCGPNLVNPNSQDITVDFNNGEGTFRLDDLPVHQGYYIGVLATEYALLKQHNRNTQEVLYELYCALYALNRLDMTGEEIGNTALDGFMIREDFPATFFQDHPDITATEREKWNVNSCVNHGGYSNDCFKGIGTSNEELLAAKRFGKWNEMAMSIDHYSRILMGLALVVKFVDDTDYSFEYFNGNFTTHYFQDNLFKIKAEAKAISNRIVSYLKNNNWFLMMPNTTKAWDNIPLDIQIDNCVNVSNVTWGSYTEPCINCAFAPVIGLPTPATALGVLAPRGCNAVMAAFGYAKAGGAIQSDFDKNNLGYDLYNDAITFETRFFWDFFDIADKPGVLSYLSILAAVGDSKLTAGLINTTQMDLKQHDVLNYKWGFHSLLNAVLWDERHEPTYDYALDRLNVAPCKGPDRSSFVWNDNNTFDTDTYLKEGTPDYENVKLNGLDYMLLFNLYLLKNPNYVKYGRFNIDDISLTGNLPIVIPFPNQAPFYLTAVGTSTTGAEPIVLPEPVEIWSLGKITSNQILEHKNLSGTYYSFDYFLEPGTLTVVKINVNTAVKSVLSVNFKSIEEIEIIDGFVGEEGNEYSFVPIEFKCNALGNGYELPQINNNPKKHSDFHEKINTVNLNQKEDQSVEEPEKKKFSLRPNPNDGSFEVSFLNRQNEPTMFVIVDLYGKEILREVKPSNLSNKWIINLDDNRKGMFILKIFQLGELLATEKIIVK
jgi:hypothetical protein